MNDKERGWLLVCLVAMVMSGCASIDCGPMKARTLGADANIKSGTWTKITSNQIEVIQFEGYARNESKTSKAGINLVGVIAGGLIGSVGGPATAAGGSLIGGGTAELVQRAIDALKPKTDPAQATNTPAVNVPPSAGACACDLSRPVASAYEDVRQVTISDPQGEECGLEAREGILIRPMVTYSGHTLSVSSIFAGKVKKVDGGYELPCPTEWLGYQWHVVGYSLGDDHADRMQVRFTPGQRIFVPRDGKRAFVFVEGRK